MTVVLSYGMGVESTAILMRWLLEPRSRDFPLGELTVLTAQTGDEFPDTGDLVEEFVLPAMREHGVRLVQVARTSYSRADVLDDDNQPEMVHLRGIYSLSEEMLVAGTIPQTGGSGRKCSIHAKGWALDAWIDANVEGEFRHVIGFNAGELRRIEKDQSYSTKKRHSEHPLLEWGWDRKACEDYLLDLFGVPWQKSCCYYCPFSAGKEPVRIRYRTFPDLAAQALLMERMSMVLNPRMTLYTDAALLDVLREDGNGAAVSMFEDILDRTPSAVYHLRRAYIKKNDAMRSVKIETTGSRVEMETLLARKYGAPEVDDFGIHRVVLSMKNAKRKAPNGMLAPNLQMDEFYVVGPHIAREKQESTFEAVWDNMVHERLPQGRTFTALETMGVIDPVEEARKKALREEKKAAERTKVVMAGSCRGCLEVENGADFLDEPDSDDDRRDQTVWESEMVKAGILPAGL